MRETLFDRLPATASLAFGGAVVWLLIGIPIGIISAIKRGTLLDRAAMGFALLAISAPVYWVGLVSIYLFSEDLGKLAPIFKGSGQYTPFTEDPVAWASALILPWLVLATAFAAIYARFLRASRRGRCVAERRDNADADGAADGGRGLEKVASVGCHAMDRRGMSWTESAVGSSGMAARSSGPARPAYPAVMRQPSGL